MKIKETVKLDLSSEEDIKVLQLIESIYDIYMTLKEDSKTKIIKCLEANKDCVETNIEGLNQSDTDDN